MSVVGVRVWIENLNEQIYLRNVLSRYVVSCQQKREHHEIADEAGVCGFFVASSEEVLHSKRVFSGVWNSI